jgi:hypothetical protein
MLLGGGATAYQSPYISSVVSNDACSGPPSPTTSPVSLAPLTLVQSLPPPPIPIEPLHHQRTHQGQDVPKLFFVVFEAPAYKYSLLCLPACLSACLSVCLPAVCMLSVCLPAICLLSLCLSVCQPVHLSACPSVSLSVCLSVRLSVCLPVGLSACPSVCQPACLSAQLSVCLTLFCLSVCLLLS